MLVGRLSGTGRCGGLAIILGALLLTGCGGGGDDLTLEEQLEKLAGRPLSVSEVDDQLALADTMCSFDTKVLTEIWPRLDARQLEFQDFVFGQHCPDRLSVYEAARLMTGEVPEDLPEAEAETGIETDDLSPSDLLESITADDGPTTTTSDSSSTTRRSTTSTTAGTASTTN